MDLNKKGRSWVGTICNQFEAIFQDVDNIARKEAVKFVADQVHSVGDSVKRLYSDAVQDVLHIEEENLKLQERLEASSQVDAGSYQESDTGTSTKPVCVTKDDQLLGEQGSFNDLKNSDALVSIPSDYCVTEVTDPTSMYPFEETSTLLPLREDNNVIINDADNTFEDLINTDAIQETAILDSNLIFSEAYCDLSDKETVSILEKMDSSDNDEFPSNISTDDGLSNVEAPNSEPIIVSGLGVCEEKIPVVGSLLSSGCDVDNRALNGDESLCDGIPTEDTRLDVSGQTTDLLFSYSSCGDGEADTGDVSPTFSASLRTLNIVEFKSEDLTQKGEILSNSLVESDGSTCTSSTSCSATLAYAAKTIDTLTGMELNDFNSFSSTESVLSVGRSQSKHGCCHEDAQSKSASSPSEAMDILPVIEANGNSSQFGAADIDHGMETIDLTDDVKSIDFSFDVKYDRKDVLNWNFGFPSSQGRKNLRYYKNLIKGALASRKRRSKEYEHLGICYGDIDVESRHNFDLSSVQSFPRSINETETEPFDTCTSDWELL